MEPLTALGLAANIFQFIDFASKLFSLGQDIYRAGESTRNIGLRLILKDLRVLSERLRDNTSASSSATLNEDDQALHVLATECITIADDLTHELEKLKLDSKRPSKWRSFRHVLSSIWKEDTINSLYTKLEALRRELAFRLTVMMKNKMDFMAVTQDTRFSKLDESTSRIIRILLQAPSEIISALDKQTFQIYQRHDQSDRLAISLQQETLLAIRDLRSSFSGSSRLLLGQNSAVSKERLSVMEASTQLLDKLKFRQMYAREESVEDAFPETFRWIFQDKNSKGFSPFGPWIREGKGCYWVNGKAGSGKSTLMKALHASPKVNELINEWAGNHRLITASFFFWRNGTILQRSQEGLLRWLLYTILLQEPKLIEKCFPETIEKIRDSHKLNIPDDVDHEEGDYWDDYVAEFDEQVKREKDIPFIDLVKQAYRHLSAENLASFKIFLFIDGVDEFDGDHTEISEFFRELSSSLNFKIVLSSRPIRPCVEAFKQFPNLRLQDFTQNDMKTYLDGTIGSHPMMRILLSENAEEASKLIEMILSKASGVFLWVRLVAKSLLNGFQNYDRVSDLIQRVDELPTELSHLYLHMFEKMEKRYQTHAAQLIRMVVRGEEIQPSGALTILQLSFADESTHSKAITAPASPISDAELQVRSETMEGRLQSRCCGLVEVVNAGQRIPIVQVLHKSVLDFLAEENITGVLYSRSPKFDPDRTLFSGSLLAIKRSPEYPKNLYEKGPVMDFLAYLHAVEKSTSQPQIEPLRELIHVIYRELDTGERQKYTFTNRASESATHKLALSYRIAMAGLARYIHYILEEPEKQRHILVNFDAIAIFERLFTTMIDSYLKEHPIFPLVEEYTQILESLLSYTVKVWGTPSLSFIWRHTLAGIERIKDESSDSFQDAEHLKLLQSFLTIISAFLYLNNGIPPDSQKPDTSGRSNGWVANLLLQWFEDESNRLNKHYDDEAAVLVEIRKLRTIITDWVTPREEDLGTWANQIYRGRTQSPPRVRVVPGGPFELDSGPISVANIIPSQSHGNLSPARPVPQDSQSLQTPQHNHRRSRSAGWSNRLRKFFRE